MYNEKDMSKVFSFQINSCGIYHCGPNWSWAVEGHEDYTLWAVFCGVGRITVGESTFHVKQGNCFLLPPKAKIRAEHDPNFPLYVISAHFDFIENNEIVRPYPLLHKVISAPEFFHGLLQRLVTAHYAKNERGEVAWMGAIFSEFSALPPVDETNKLKNDHFACVQEICNAMNENPSLSASLSAFALKYNYSPTYLGKIFHKVTGVTFSQYLTGVRIHHAKVMLVTGEESITEIAEKLAYYNACHFINQFKREVGCSPGAYRKASFKR